MSSGCKTLLNIVKHPDKVVNVEECGPNVLRIIFTMDNIKIYMSRPTLFDIPDDDMLFLRNCDGLNVSDKSFKVLKFDNNRITLEDSSW